MNLYSIAFAATAVFHEPITVIRRTQTVGQNGRASETQQSFPNIMATVLSQGPNDLERETDYSAMERTIEVSAAFAIQGPAPGHQPDYVVWHGTTFIVSEVKDFSKQGVGFTTVICKSQQMIDPPPMQP